MKSLSGLQAQRLPTANQLIDGFLPWVMDSSKILFVSVGQGSSEHNFDFDASKVVCSRYVVAAFSALEAFHGPKKTQKKGHGMEAKPASVQKNPTCF